MRDHFLHFIVFVGGGDWGGDKAIQDENEFSHLDSPTKSLFFCLDSSVPSLFMNLRDFMCVVSCFLLGYHHYEKGALEKNQVEMLAMSQTPHVCSSWLRSTFMTRRKSQVKLLQSCDPFYLYPDMIFVKSFTQAYTLILRNLPEEKA